MWVLLTVVLWGTSVLTFPMSANGFWLPKDMAWLLGSFFLASSSFWNPPSRPGIVNPALGWLLAWITLSFGWFVCWPLMTIPQETVGFHRAVIGRWYISPILPTVTFLGSVFALDALVRQTDYLGRWTRVARHLVWIASVFALMVVAQALRLDPLTAVFPLHGAMPDRPIALLGNATLTGNFMAMIAPICLMFHAPRYRIGVFGLLLAAIILTGSATSLVAAWIGSTMVWGLQRRWRWVAGSVVMTLLVAGGMTLWGRETLSAWLNPSGRVELWRTAWAFWLGHPLNAWIGFGAGSVGALTTNGVWNYGFLHNELVQWTFEFGLIGAGLLLLAWWSAFHALRQMVWTGASTAWVGAAVAYGLISLTSFPLRIGSLLMVGVVIAAAVVAHGQPEGGHHA